MLFAEALKRGSIVVNYKQYKNKRVEQILKNCKITRKNGLQLDIKECDERGGNY